MKTTMSSFTNSASMYIAACLMATTALLMGCEATSDEVQPLIPGTAEEISAAKGRDMKDLPHKELGMLRAAVGRYHNIEHALADGYTFKLTDHRSQMGYHYLKPSLLDDHFEIERPEVLMYVLTPNGRWAFVGVEYAVPITDMNNPQPAPEGFTGDADEWAINREFEVWTLHVWVGLHNPNGIFASHNPRLP